MRRALPLLAILALGWTGLPARIGAQDAVASAGPGTIAVRFLKIDGETVNTISPRPLGVDDCTQPTAVLEFELDNVPSKSTLDVYYGSECNLTDRDSTTTPKCTFVDTFDIQGRTQDVSVKIDAAKLWCGAGGEPVLWFLAVNSSRSSEEIGTDYGVFGQMEPKLTIDVDPPGAPSKVEGGAGERQIPVEWESEDTDLQRFVVYIDSGAGRGGDDRDGGGGGDCHSSKLTPGTPGDEVPRSVPTKTIEEGTATGIDLSTDDIDGDFAAVAVVAFDEAGNASPLSELACVEVVPTEGFWERYESNGGKAVDGCECRAHAGSARASGLGGALPVSLALFALTRVRRRRT